MQLAITYCGGLIVYFYHFNDRSSAVFLKPAANHEPEWIHCLVFFIVKDTERLSECN